MVWAGYRAKHNLMSIIKIAYNTLEHLLVIFHRIMKNGRCNSQDNLYIFQYYIKCY
jgi:hypothetical protein